MAKTIIYYHRAYRKITGSGWKFLFQLIGLGLLLFLSFVFICPDITRLMSLFAQDILSNYSPPGTILINDQPYLLGKIYFVDIPGYYPTAFTTLANLIISIGLVILLPQIKKYKNLAIFFTFMAIVNAASALFFTFSSSNFPYTVTQFSELYVKSQMSMWFFLPFILGMAILLMPAPFIPKLFLIILTFVYSIAFGTLRYILFLFILYKYSVIYMALLFFAFGPLIDFVYIVGIYSYYNSKVAKTLSRNRMVWKWSF